ncbi:uncharacterized protein N7482_009121 [Penicillium canariense]|uniref:Carotenoid oxygenase n=1 Tax=Penicillium canariense TaxID=189055 RepID=A0A9W9HM47_9EURO|nr:uncharacterized protein N7482_009121 [Penicillium canariense]KAJ5152643.1 hypothetical protein N7482_009121 [Penicillium canariense]
METTAASRFPDRPQFSGFMKPCRVEGNVEHLEVLGEIPKNIDGTFYRVMPDPQLPPYIQDDPWFNGDGNISAFKIKDGKYRNKFTDAVEFKVRSTANTNVVFFNGQLLALKEDSPPYALDPTTLETKGLHTFGGLLSSLTFTAHPKFDPKTGEMICFGYEAKGDGTPDICYYNVTPAGEFSQTLWLVAPVVAMIHDFAVTDNWVLFPLIPQLCDIDRLKQGGEHWQWSADTPFYVGLLPRRGAIPSDVKWFQYKNSFPGHTANAYEDDEGQVVFDVGLSEKNVFFWWPDSQGNAPAPSSIHSQLTRFIINPRSNNLELDYPEVLHSGNSEFYRIDDRFATRKYRHCFFNSMIPELGTDFPKIAPKLGGGYPLYNSLTHYDIMTGNSDVYCPGTTHMVQEPVFIPRKGSTEEADGYILVLVNNYDTMNSELHLLDTKSFERPQAVILLPLRLRQGLHGNWVDADDLRSSGEWPERVVTGTDD